MVAIQRTQNTSSLLERPLCESCGTPTGLMRREPHPQLGPRYELVTFECQSCGHVQTRDVGLS